MTAYTSKLNTLPTSVGYANGDTLTLADGSRWAYSRASGWTLVTPSGMPYLMRNMTAASLPALRTGLAKALAGVSNCRVGYIGDSVDAGSPGAVTAWWAASNTTQLARLMTRAGLVVSAAGFVGSHGASGVGSTLNVLDPRVSAYASGWGEFANPTLSPGGAALSNASTTAVQTFTPGGTTDTADIYYLDAGNSDTIVVGGGANGLTSPQNVTPTRLALTIKRATVTIANTTVWGVAKATADGSPIFVLGVVPYTAANKELQLVNLGIAGVTSTQYADTSAFWAAGKVLTTAGSAFSDYSAMFINLGINDALGIPLATTKANIQSLITGIKALGVDVILVTPTPWNPAAIPQATQDAMCQMYYDLADANGCVLIDLNAGMGGFATEVASGFVTDGAGHLSLAGNGANAMIRAQLFRALGL